MFRSIAEHPHGRFHNAWDSYPGSLDFLSETFFVALVLLPCSPKKALPERMLPHQTVKESVQRAHQSFAYQRRLPRALFQPEFCLLSATVRLILELENYSSLFFWSGLFALVKAWIATRMNRAKATIRNAPTTVTLVISPPMRRSCHTSFQDSGILEVSRQISLF